jgi:subtilisin family serine protease
MKKQTQTLLCVMILLSEVANAQFSSLQHTWVFFRNKGTTTFQSTNPALLGISERALKRRTKVLSPDCLIDQLDLPVSEAVIAQIEQTGVKIRTISRWLNAVSVEGTQQQIQAINKLLPVAATEQVAVMKRPRAVPSSSTPPPQSFKKTSGSQGLDYGPSATQLTNMKVIDLHAIGVTGTGVLIAMLDDGFNNYRTHDALKNIKIVADSDFIHNINDVNRQPWEVAGQGDHGAGTLSAVGGFVPGQLIGAAYGASFILAKTEMDSSGSSYDFNSEEDTYVAGLEWAERLGADITSSSLGYKEFWSSPTYTTSDMNGRTTKVAQAAAIASRKGVLVVTAMGNDGDMPMGLHRDSTLVSPADADSIISVGATASDGELASFSGCGPTADGRIKPEVVAQGMAVYWADGSSTTSYNYVQGTSCSTPLVAGAAALLLSAHPELNNIQVRQAILAAARHINDGTKQTSMYPNNYYGYGFVDALEAATYFGPVFSNVPLIVQTTTGFTITTMIVSKYELYPDSIFYYYHYDDTSAYSRAQLFPTMNSNEYSTSIPPSSNNSFPSGYFVAHEEFGKPQYIPTSFLLMQNYPNPFNYGTTIKFELPIAAKVELAVFNLLGQRIKTIFQGKVKTTGSKQWDGTNDHGVPVATGVYFARLKTLDKIFSIKMLLLK